MDNDDSSREARYRLYCEQRMAQQIRENSQELRELETRIRAAYVNKSLKVQLAEREKKRLEEKIQIENDIQLMKQKLNDDLQRERQKKEELRVRQERHRRELMEQIADKQFKRKILYEEFLKEKIIIDEIMAQIEREQIEYDKRFKKDMAKDHCFATLLIFREIQEKIRKTECLREDIMRLIKEQEEWKEQQKRIAAEENEKIARYMADREERAKQIKKMDREKLLTKLEQQEKMCSELDEMEVNHLHFNYDFQL